MSYPLLEKKSYLTIGFSDVLKHEPEVASKLQNGDMDKEMFNSLIEKTYKTMGKGRWFLWHFLKDFQKGDKVIVPWWGTFAATEILEPARPISGLEGQLGEDNIRDWKGRQLIALKDNGLFVKDANGSNLPVDLGFFVKVKPLIAYKGSVFAPRNGFLPNHLLKKLKYRGTNYQLTDQSAEIEKAIERANKDERIDFHEIVAQSTVSQIKTFMRNIPSDSEFEKLVQYYFEKLGAKVEIPNKNAPGKGDGDADVIAQFEELGVVVLVQVKQHTDNTGEHAVYQIKTYIEQQVDQFDMGQTLIGWVISAGDGFSEQAKHDAIQDGGKQIRLINGEEFARMLLDVGFAGINEVLVKRGESS